MDKKTVSTKDITYTAVGVILIAIGAWISIPMTVPFTLQTFSVFAVLSILGGRKGTLAVLVYLLTGMIGFPVFSSFRGGAGVLLGATGGYLVGFIFIGISVMIAEKAGAGRIGAIAAMVAGLLICYAFGTVWFISGYANDTGSVGVMTALSWCVFPFIIPDLVKLAAAAVLSERVKKILGIEASEKERK